MRSQSHCRMIPPPSLTVPRLSRRYPDCQPRPPATACRIHPPPPVALQAGRSSVRGAPTGSRSERGTTFPHPPRTHAHAHAHARTTRARATRRRLAFSSRLRPKAGLYARRVETLCVALRCLRGTRVWLATPAAGTGYGRRRRRAASPPRSPAQKPGGGRVGTTSPSTPTAGSTRRGTRACGASRRSAGRGSSLRASPTSTTCCTWRTSQGSSRRGARTAIR